MGSSSYPSALTKASDEPCQAAHEQVGAGQHILSIKMASEK